MKTAEEMIEKYYMTTNDEKSYMECEMCHLPIEQFVKLMEEYARQSSSLSDEEIEKWAYDKSVESLSGTNYTPIVIEMNELAMKAAITGAKWARDRLKGGKP